MERNSEKSSMYREYAAIVSVMFVIGSVFAFLIASYLNRGSIQYFFSFHGSDGPSGYANSINPQRFGVHTFGDYLLPRWQSQLSNPWFIKDTAQGPLNNYLPFGMVLFWFFGLFPYWKSLVVYMAVPLSVLLYVIATSIVGGAKSEKIHLLISSVVLTLPFISIMDRGNVQIYVIAFLALALLLFGKKHYSLGAISLGFAIALKGYPIFLILPWVKARRWKDVIIAGVTSISLTVVPLIFYEGGITRNISRILRNVRINEHLYSYESLAFNSSLKGSFLTLTRLDFLGLERLFSRLYNNFTLVFLIILLMTFVIFVISDLDHIEIVLISVTLMSIYVDFVGGYALSVYFLFIIALGQSKIRMNRNLLRLVMFLVAINMTPKGFPLRFWSQDPSGPTPTYNSLLGGVASLSLLLVVLGVVLHRSLTARRVDVAGLDI